MDIPKVLAQVKRIAFVAFGSFAAMVAMTILTMMAFAMFGNAQQVDEFIFGEYGGYVRILMVILAYPILWRYMRGDQRVRVLESLC
jgi:hypothetical protein